MQVYSVNVNRSFVVQAETADEALALGLTAGGNEERLEITVSEVLDVDMDDFPDLPGDGWLEGNDTEERVPLRETITTTDGTEYK